MLCYRQEAFEKYIKKQRRHRRKRTPLSVARLLMSYLLKCFDTENINIPCLFIIYLLSCYFLLQQTISVVKV